MKLSKEDYSFLSDYLVDTPEIKEETVFNTMKTVSSDVRNKIIKNPLEFHWELELNSEVNCEYSLKKLSIASIVMSEWDWEYENKIKQNSDKLTHKENNIRKLEIYYWELWRGISEIIKIKDFLLDKWDNIWESNIDSLYRELSQIIFNTDNLDEISKNFSKEERKKYRLFMIKFIDNLEKLKTKKENISNNKDLINYLNALKDYQIPENEIIDYEFLPFWLVVYLEDETFNNYLWSGNTLWLKINWEILWLMCKESINFKDFWGSILFIKWDKKNKSTYEHEKTHLIYDRFFRTLLDYNNEQMISIYWYEEFYSSQKKEDINISFDLFLEKTLKTLFEVSVEMAKDEVNAYYKEGRKLFLLSNFWYESFAWILDEIILDLKENEKVNEKKYPKFREQIKNMKNRYLEEVWFYVYIINFFDDFEDFPEIISWDKDNLRLTYQFFINKWNKKLIQTLWYQYKHFKSSFEEINTNNIQTIQNFINYWDKLDSILDNTENLNVLINAINMWSFHYQDEYFSLIIKILNLTNNTELEETLLLYIHEYFSIYSHDKTKILLFQDKLYTIWDKYWDYKYYYIDIIDKMLVDEKNTLI